MKVIALIDPPQGDVIEKILRHCGLWQPSTPRPPPGENGLVYVPDDDGGGQTAFCDGPGEFVPVPDPSQMPARDEPWEVTCDAYGDSFDASF